MWIKMFLYVWMEVRESVNANVCMSISENVYVDKNMCKCNTKFVSLDMKDKLKVRNLKVYHPMSSPNPMTKGCVCMYEWKCMCMSVYKKKYE